MLNRLRTLHKQVDITASGIIIHSGTKQQDGYRLIEYFAHDPADSLLLMLTQAHG
tara:strand:- start:165 stop:329 length:165 start_codon:yes stop_codon:yes gene_type:complete